VTHQDIKLVIFSTDEIEVASLKARFSLANNISVVLGSGPEVSKRYQLDALWLGPMQASYFGIDQPLAPHIGQVFPMPKDKRTRGFPLWLIPGVALVPGREYSKSYLDSICARALADAIHAHNLSHSSPILRVGSIPGNLGLEDPEALEAFRAVNLAFATQTESIATRSRVDQHQSA
jgi:hypothetical protein